MKYAIIGSQRCTTTQGYATLRKYLVAGDGLVTVSNAVSGSTMEEKFAANNSYQITVIRGPKNAANNREMVGMCDELIAFLDKATRWETALSGARDVLCDAKDAGKTLHIVWV